MKRNKSPQRSLGFSCFSRFIVVVLHIIHETSFIPCCLMSNIKAQCSLYYISTPSLVAIETTQGICIPQGSIIEIWNQQIAWWIRTAICLEGCLFFDFGNPWMNNQAGLCLSKSCWYQFEIILYVETENLGHGRCFVAPDQDCSIKICDFGLSLI